jgi:membrane protein YdbS with pleckstrin-like domain
MTNWHDTLTPDEFVLHEFSVSNRFRLFGFGFWSVMALLLVSINSRSALVILVAIVIVLWAMFYFGFYLPRAYNYAFTNRRVLAQQGWLNTQSISVNYNRITDVSTRERFLGRLLTNSGTLIINTAGTGTHEIIMPYVESPRRQRQILERIQLSGMNLYGVQEPRLTTATDS